jgi:hypothetical protein
VAGGCKGNGAAVIWPGREADEGNSWDGEGRHCCCSAAAGAEWKRNRAMENERVRGSCSVKERGE